MNKRAISDLVATVLLVLIVIAAVGIIWGAIMPIIRQNIDTSQKCLNTGIEINTASGYTYVTSYGNASLQISRGPSTVEVMNITLKLVDNTGNSNSTVIGTISANSDKVVILSNTTMGLAMPKRAGVAATIVIGKTSVACPMKEVELPAAA